MTLLISRRELIAATSAAFAFQIAPAALAAGTVENKRLLTVVLRGALDGLALAAPTGDPTYESARGGLIVPASQIGPEFRLNDTFSLNPNMKNLAGLYHKKQALIVHAVATPYRRRSHFDGQDILESGHPAPRGERTGWMNRLIQQLPHVRTTAGKIGFAAGADLPLIMRGKAGVVSWAPPGLPASSDDTRARLLDIYNHSSPEMAELFEAGLELEGLSEATGASGSMTMGNSMSPRGASKLAKATAIAAGKLLSSDDGPRIGAMDLQGFDTHARQNPLKGRLVGLLKRLDDVIGQLEVSMADVWDETVVLFITEFGRTVRMNGTGGTDHGVGTVAILVGGAVNGGRVVADWPGLSAGALFEGRDLHPTTDLRAVLKGVASEHLGVPGDRLAGEVFPDSQSVRPMADLVRT